MGGIGGREEGNIKHRRVPVPKKALTARKEGIINKVSNGENKKPFKKPICKTREVKRTVETIF